MAATSGDVAGATRREVVAGGRHQRTEPVNGQRPGAATEEGEAFPQAGGRRLGRHLEERYTVVGQVADRGDGSLDQTALQCDGGLQTRLLVADGGPPRFGDLAQVDGRGRHNVAIVPARLEAVPSPPI